ncbi:MAG: ABC transporter permease subunit [Phycisphaeraceae bacterium]|nr:ABC transporter permease subunit [Phycisphaerales bacterium]MCB9860033.1 ABC transporter permease subunit [Phycisphaeraceae bacterium]
MRMTWTVFKRELAGYFATPVAYVFIVIFLVLAGTFAFAEEFGALYERGQADLASFFVFHPWLYLFLIPALSMRLWAEERHSGTFELLMTLPIPTWSSVVGKFLAAWVFTGITLALTCPVWITVWYLGDPDHGAIAAGYIGSFLMAGGFLAIGACMSALTRSQVVAFILSVVACFVMLLAGHNVVQSLMADRVPEFISETIKGFSFLTRFDSISRGVIAPNDLVFSFSLIAVLLAANTIIVNMKKAG